MGMIKNQNPKRPNNFPNSIPVHLHKGDIMKPWKKIYSLFFLLTLLITSCNLVPPAPTATPTLAPTLTPVPTSIPTNTLVPTNTPVPTPTLTPVVVQVEIQKPLDGEKVDKIITVEGTSQNIPEGFVVWVVMFLPGTQRYYPMNDPAVILVNGDWTSQTYVGQDNDHGMKADIYAVLANSDAQDAFKAYLAEAISRNDYPGMPGFPEGAQVYSRVSVTRK